MNEWSEALSADGDEEELMAERKPLEGYALRHVILSFNIHHRADVAHGMRNRLGLPYYIRRLLPFFLAYFGYEAVEVGWGALAGQAQGDVPSVNLLGLLNETTVSFLFCFCPIYSTC